MSQASVPAFRAGLSSMSAILDKTLAQCAERKIDPAVLMVDRLAPDMFPFTRQVQIAADFAKNTVAFGAASRSARRRRTQGVKKPAVPGSVKNEELQDEAVGHEH